MKERVSDPEAMEVEKSKAITPDDRNLWSRFFNALSPVEADALFLALRKEVFESGHVILQQGQPNDKLFFIEKGLVQLLYSDRDKAFLIEKLGSGDIFGEDTFFSLNVCTASVKTLTELHVSTIERSVFDKLDATHISLGKNLEKACGSGKSVFNRLRQKGIDRRSFKRINLSIKVSIQLLVSDAPEVMQRSVKAELWDISKGGLSFYFQSKNPDAVRNLIGQHIGVRLDLIIDGQTKTVALSGMVHGVQSHPLDDYSVHLKFNRRLSDTAIKTIERIAENAMST